MHHEPVGMVGERHDACGRRLTGIGSCHVGHLSPVALTGGDTPVCAEFGLRCLYENDLGIGGLGATSPVPRWRVGVDD
jgi:hypothetical protein